MKFSKFIGLISGIIQIGSAVTLILGMHTLLGVFVTAFPEGANGIEIKFTDPVIIPINLSPANHGFLEAKMDISISIIIDGVEKASDSVVIILPPGKMVPVELELIISSSNAQEYFKEGSVLQWNTEIIVTTLYDLISFSNNMVFNGGIL